MRVTYYQRKPRPGRLSIERVFDAVHSALPERVRARIARSRFDRGVLRRAYNALEAAWRQGSINHVTGDIHYVALLLRKRRTVLTIHDCVGLNRLRGVRWFLLWLLWYWLPVKRAARVTVISEASRRELLDVVRCDPAKIVVVHDPISSDFVHAPRPFHEKQPTILQVGTKENKNLLRVAEALRGIPCHLRIIGMLSPDQEHALREAEVDYSSVSGISDEAIVQEYRAADMLLFASTYEGFGLPIVEAQATGRPVVTSNICSMPEVAGDGACLVDPHDVASIRAGIVRVINDRAYREELVANGLRNVKRFTAEAIAGQYAALYEEMIASVE